MNVSKFCVINVSNLFTVLVHYDNTNFFGWSRFDVIDAKILLRLQFGVKNALLSIVLSATPKCIGKDRELNMKEFQAHESRQGPCRQPIRNHISIRNHIPYIPSYFQQLRN
eukprot:TRINITY_DN49094_c0_g1_i1.p2 TRINITY_DN49094_c0_g1~~TRINITY_DN49094_c0_g1_i1.p2  ORF type:complete len:111 (-),score=10.40 TRINITY_DN49094_c0_g1_i1:10-342(-)